MIQLSSPYLIFAVPPSGPWLFRGADHHAGGGAGAGACSHGHVHRTGHPLLQIQTTEDEGALGALLVQSQHSQGMSASNLH